MQHIIVVDDDPEIASLFQAALETAGYRVSMALSGLDALAADTEVPADALVTDLAMPGMNGRELLERLRERRSGLPALVVSGYPNADSLDLPNTRVLSKPIGLATLVEQLQIILPPR